MANVDGTVLREQRKRVGVGLRRVAGRSGWSVSPGHLSRVERGERPVTPAIVSAYEQALGIRITDLADNPAGRPGRHHELPPELFTSTVGKLAAGGRPVTPVEQLLPAETTDLTAVPGRVGSADVTQVEEAAGLVRRLDLRSGGGLAWQPGYHLLRWAVGLQTAAMTDRVRARLSAAVGVLAAGTGWAAFDDGRPDLARTLFLLALDAAVQADDADLRGHVLADVGAHFNYLGQPEHCLTIVRLEGDERVRPAVRCVLHGVRAHAYAAQGESAACAREIDSAEVAGAAAVSAALPDWFGRFDPAHTQAVCGQAAAALAGVSGRDADRVEAHKRLAQAVEGLDPGVRGRAVALCHTRLAMLHLTAGDTSEAAVWAWQALATAADVRSTRVGRDLAAIRRVAAAHAAEPVLTELVRSLEVRTGLSGGSG